MIRKISGVTIHDFRMVQGPTHTNLIFDAAVPFQYGKTNEEVKKGIAKLITEKWSNYYAVIQANDRIRKEMITESEELRKNINPTYK